MKITSFSLITFFALSLSLSSFAARKTATAKFGTMQIRITSQETLDTFAQEEFEKEKQNKQKINI